MTETAAPILPSRDLDRTAAFYERLGFALTRYPADHYLIARRGGWELHFFHHAALDPAASDWMCYLRSADADAVHAGWQPLGLPTAGIPRLTPPVHAGYGGREFALVDPDGTLLRVGTPAG